MHHCQHCFATRVRYAGNDRARREILHKILGRLLPPKHSTDIHVRVRTLEETFASLRGLQEQTANAADHALNKLSAKLDHHLRMVEPLRCAEGQAVQDRLVDLLRLLRPQRVVGYGKKRFGSANDGGYVMVDDFAHIRGAISLGIGHNADWDSQIGARGIHVYQFDHTIDRPPVEHKNLTFERTRVAAETAADTVTLDELSTRYGELGVPSLILKIDIEADEWPVFAAASERSLSCFAQIVGEFHSLEGVVSKAWYDRAKHVFEKLNRQFGVVHVHANNVGPIFNVANVAVAPLLEITFANRDRYSLETSDETFPGPFDAPNEPARPDIYLGGFVY